MTQKLKSSFEIRKISSNQLLVMNPTYADRVRSDWFEPRWLQAEQRVVGQASGRGTVVFFEDLGEEFALRHYQRGGLVAKVSHEQYLYTGLSRTRPWREMLVNQNLYEQGLPVPVPVAARVCRSGLGYRADLITGRIQAVPLLEILQSGGGENLWKQVVALMQRCFQAGLDHPDINVRNILVKPDGELSMIDFDNAHLGAKPDALCRNIKRLLRSVYKYAAAHGATAEAVFRRDCG
jgi:3-deoxy-D-manno-octulosonic acid kinase